MYGFRFGLGYGLIGGNTYNPLINYDWSTTTTSGLRYLKDVGSTPTYNASMYFGRGAYLNGVDQRIDMVIDIKNTSNVSCSFKVTPTSVYSSARSVIKFPCYPLYIGVGTDGIILRHYTGATSWQTSTYNIAISTASVIVEIRNNLVSVYIDKLKIIENKSTEASSVTVDTMFIGSYNTSAYFWGGVIKDMFMFNRALTQSEITQAYEQPEAFYAMAQADNTCVLNMPMCETDGYIADDRNVSKANTNITPSIVGTSWTNNLDGSYTSDGTSSYLKFSEITIGKYYEISFDTFFVSGTLVGYINTAWDWNLTSGVSHKFILYSNSTFINFYSAAFNGTVSNIKATEISNIYPITNYTSSVRDNAKNLQYGLQTCKFVRDSLGVIQSASDYLECDGVGYADTGWIPPSDEDWTIECDINLIKDDSKTSWFGSSTTYIGKNANSFAYARILGFNITTNAYVTGNNKIVAGFKADTSEAFFYLNKQLVQKTTITPTAQTYSFLVGKRNGSTDVAITPINKFKIHPKALTNEEIQAL